MIKLPFLQIFRNDFVCLQTLLTFISLTGHYDFWILQNNIYCAVNNNANNNAV